MSSDVGRSSFTGTRPSIRSNTSGAGGLATSRSKMSWMYSVSGWPRALARLVSSRWSRSGTFLTWIIFDMCEACHMRRAWARPILQAAKGRWFAHFSVKSTREPAGQSTRTSSRRPLLPAPRPSTSTSHGRRARELRWTSRSRRARSSDTWRKCERLDGTGKVPRRFTAVTSTWRTPSGSPTVREAAGRVRVRSASPGGSAIGARQVQVSRGRHRR